MKLTDLWEGMVVVVDDEFTCMRAGHKRVHRDDEGEFYLTCSEGRHYLDGQENEDGELSGISLPTYP